MPKKPKVNEVACPKCKEPISVDASICPHCRTEFSSEEVAARKKSNRNAGIGCVVLLVVVLAIGMCSSGGSESDADDQPPAEAGSASAETVTAAVAFQDQVLKAMSGCDDAGKRLAEVADRISNGRATMYDGYSAADTTEDACRASWSKIKDVDLPTLFTGKAESTAEKALETCEIAAVNKQTAAAKMKEVFDGDVRPSKIQEVTEAAQSGQTAVFACVAGVLASASAAGVDLKDMETQ